MLKELKISIAILLPLFCALISGIWFSGMVFWKAICFVLSAYVCAFLIVLYIDFVMNYFDK